jgi:hypothetical protein
MPSEASPKFGKLVVRKTRDREESHKPLPTMIDSSSEPPKPEVDVDNYTDDRLKQGLKFADALLARRDTTPRTIHYVTRYKKSIQHALEAPGPRERDFLVGGVKNMEQVINDRKSIYLEVSDETKKLQAELLDLRTVEYYARYGDYLKRNPNKVRSHLTTTNHPESSQPSNRSSWTEIGAELASEKRNFLDKGDCNTSKLDTPLHCQLLDACRGLGLDFDRTRWSILEYGTRNERMHRDMDVFIAKQDYGQMATMLYHDYMDVDCIFSTIGKGEVDKQHLRSIIREHIDLYFHTEEDFDEYQMWLATDELVAATRKARDRLNTQTLAEQRAAKTAEHEERRKANLVNQSLGIAKNKNKDKKRMASTEEPRESERMTTKRCEKDDEGSQ